MLKIFVGFDGEVEPIAYHVFCQSVIEKATIPVSFTPLALNTLKGYTETHKDGSNAFIYSRFLVPYLCDYKGYALFVDGDMLCRTYYFLFFLAFDNAIATACFLGLPAFISVRMLLEITFCDLPDLSGIYIPTKKKPPGERTGGFENGMFRTLLPTHNYTLFSELIKPSAYNC
jgi:hypothetical protein